MSYPLPNIPPSPFHWPSDKQKENEFRIAQELLANCPPGTTLNDLSRTYTSPSTQETIQFTYRYFKATEGVLAKMTGSFAAGTFGNVTHAETKDGERFVLKEEEIDARSPFNEANIAIDLDKAIAGYFNETNGVRTCFTLYRYLGITLFDYLKNHNALTDEQRLDLAIQVLLALAKLHSGHDSKSKTPYVHLDIKSLNLTIDGNGKIHFIDMGFSRVLSNEMTSFKGTLYYLVQPDENGKISMVHADIYATLRTLHLPSQFRIFLTKITPKGIAILTRLVIRDKEQISCPVLKYPVLTENILMSHIPLIELYHRERVDDNDHIQEPPRTPAAAQNILIIFMSVRYPFRPRHLENLMLQQIESLIDYCDMLEKSFLSPKCIALFISPEELLSHATKSTPTATILEILAEKISSDIEQLGLTLTQTFLSTQLTQNANTFLKFISDLKTIREWNATHVSKALTIYIQQPENITRIFDNVTHIKKRSGLTELETTALLNMASEKPDLLLQIRQVIDDLNLRPQDYCMLFRDSLNNYERLINILILKGLETVSANFNRPPRIVGTFITELRTQLQHNVPHDPMTLLKQAIYLLYQARLSHYYISFFRTDLHHDLLSQPSFQRVQKLLDITPQAWEDIVKEARTQVQGNHPPRAALTT